MMVSGGITGGAAFAWTQRASDDFSGHVFNDDLTVNAIWTRTLGASGSIIYTNFNTGQNNGVGNCLYNYSGSVLSVQYSQFTMTTGSAGNPQLGCIVRCQAGPSCYLLYYNSDSTVRLNRCNTGTFTDIAGPTARSYVNGNRLRLEAIGSGNATRLTAYEDVGSGFVVLFNSVDPGATYIDNGTPGLYGGAANDLLRFDDWSGGDGA